MTSVAREQILNKHEQRAAAMERHGKHIPAEINMHATEERCFLRGPWRDVISKGHDYSLVSLWTEDLVRVARETVEREPPYREDFSTEPEE
jgi:hypothetical protein